MFQKRSIAAAMVLGAMLLTTAGCGSSTTNQTAPAPQPAATEAPKPALKFGIVTSQSGAFQAWGTDFSRAFEIGLDYATGGTRTVNGRKIELVYKDDQGKADIGKQMAIEAFEKDKVDLLFGNVSSGVTLQILPLLEQYKKVMIVEPAASDAITTTNFTRYAFRTGSNTTQDALAGAVGAAKLANGGKILEFAPDYDWGHNSADAWKAVMLQNGVDKANIVEKFIPQDATDFLPFLKQVQAEKPAVMVVHWSAAATAPKLYQQIGQLGMLQQMKVTGGIADMRSMKSLQPGLVGMVKYFHTFPKTKENDFLVSEYAKRYNGEKPELFSAGGMAAAIAAVEALKKTGGDADAEKLIATLEGMSFNGPKGVYTLRKEDHQALQPMYVAELANNPGFDFPTPTLKTELKPEETAPPINVKK